MCLCKCAGCVCLCIEQLGINQDTFPQNEAKADFEQDASYLFLITFLPLHELLCVMHSSANQHADLPHCCRSAALLCTSCTLIHCCITGLSIRSLLERICVFPSLKWNCGLKQTNSNTPLQPFAFFTPLTPLQILKMSTSLLSPLNITCLFPPWRFFLPLLCFQFF